MKIFVSILLAILVMALLFMIGASCNYQSYNCLRRFVGDYLYVSFLEVSMIDFLIFIFGLLMAGCGVAMFIALSVLMALLIKSFKED